MPWEPQSLLVFAVVATAVAYLGWRAWRTIRGRAGSHCGSSCGGCGDKSLVKLDAPADRPSSHASHRSREDSLN